MGNMMEDAVGMLMGSEVLRTGDGAGKGGDVAAPAAAAVGPAGNMAVVGLDDQDDAMHADEVRRHDLLKRCSRRIYSFPRRSAPESRKMLLVVCAFALVCYYFKYISGIGSRFPSLGAHIHAFPGLARVRCISFVRHPPERAVASTRARITANFFVVVYYRLVCSPFLYFSFFFPRFFPPIFFIVLFALTFFHIFFFFVLFFHLFFSFLFFLKLFCLFLFCVFLLKRNEDTSILVTPVFFFL